MKLSFEEVNILGNIVNNVWGKSSTSEQEYSHSSASAVTKASIQDNVLSLMALTIVNLGSHGQQHKQIASTEKELDKYLDKYLSNIKKEFKKKENAGRSLKCKQIKNSEDTNVEIINFYASTRSAYIRRTVKFEIE